MHEHFGGEAVDFGDDGVVAVVEGGFEGEEFFEFLTEARAFEPAVGGLGGVGHFIGWNFG